MVSKTTRKIIKLGNKKYQSFAITLPLDWFRFNQPYEVDIYYNSLVVVVVPNKSEKLEEKLLNFMQMLYNKKDEVSSSE